MTELKALSKLKMAGKLRYWRGTIEIPETELHAICDEIQAEHDKAIAATLGNSKSTADAIAELRKVVREAFSGESVSILVEGHAIMRAIDAVEAATLGSERDEIYDAGFDSGVKATLQQLEGVIACGDGLADIEAWIDEQWKEYES